MEGRAAFGSYVDDPGAPGFAPKLDGLFVPDVPGLAWKLWTGAGAPLVAPAAPAGSAAWTALAAKSMAVAAKTGNADFMGLTSLLSITQGVNVAGVVEFHQMSQVWRPGQRSFG
jgi:hypothetical protein